MGGCALKNDCQALSPTARAETWTLTTTAPSEGHVELPSGETTGCFSDQRRRANRCDPHRLHPASGGTRDQPVHLSSRHLRPHQRPSGETARRTPPRQLEGRSDRHPSPPRLIPRLPIHANLPLCPPDAYVDRIGQARAHLPAADQTHGYGPALRVTLFQFSNQLQGYPLVQVSSSICEWFESRQETTRRSRRVSCRRAAPRQ